MKKKSFDLLKRIYIFIIKLLGAYYPRMWAEVRYFVAYRKRINLKNPSDFSEKLVWLRLNTYSNNDVIISLMDKVLVRDYVRSLGLEHILNDLFFVWEDPNQILWDSLPQAFVAKISQGCDAMIICPDKNNLDLDKAKKEVQRWKKGNLLYDLEIARIAGKKRKEIKKYYFVEKYLRGVNTVSPDDYKIYCFHGVPKAVLVVSDRFGADTRGGIFDINWNKLDDISGNFVDFENSIIPPKSWDDMLSAASQLSKGFPFVRVDFYDYEGKAVFGEMTFFPSGCIKPVEANIDGKSMGELIDLTSEVKTIV
ncbi:MAG: ATP-grasp fold amidoligase family protein [Christensenellales bacterium]|jgi:hypothetical protein